MQTAASVVQEEAEESKKKRALKEQKAKLTETNLRETNKMVKVCITRTAESNGSYRQIA